MLTKDSLQMDSLCENFSNFEYLKEAAIYTAIDFFNICAKIYQEAKKQGLKAPANVEDSQLMFTAMVMCELVNHLEDPHIAMVEAEVKKTGG